MARLALTGGPKLSQGKTQPGTSKSRCPANLLRIMGSSPFTLKWRARHFKVIREKCSEALHILDSFHIVAKMNKALDEVRATETRRMQREGREPVLKKSRWLLLKRSENLDDGQHFRFAISSDTTSGLSELTFSRKPSSNSGNTTRRRGPASSLTSGAARRCGPASNR